MVIIERLCPVEIPSAPVKDAASERDEPHLV